MKKILIPVSFSKSSENSLRHAALLYEEVVLTLLNVYPVKKYSRKYNFGKEKYSVGIRGMLRNFYNLNVKEPRPRAIFLAHSGTTSQSVDQISSQYDLMVLSRKAHPSKKNGYFTNKKLFIATHAHCPVLIMPFTKTNFKLEDCNHVWHIQRKKSESKVVSKGMTKLRIKPEKMEVKSLQQTNFISSFWENIVAYENSHDEKLLRKIDEAHDSELIDLIVLVDNEQSIFTKFFKSDVIHLFCKYGIPILIFRK